jgi:hypothetical protein
MAKEKAEKIEFTDEEKKAFIAENTKVIFWANRDLVKEFDRLAKEKGLGRKEALIKLMQKYIDKQNKKTK